MTQMDEDAPALAGVAAQAVHVLNDATCASVQSPGLDGLTDTEAVVVSLTRLAEDLQDTAAHLDDFLIEQLTEDRITGHDGSDATAATAVLSARHALEQVRVTAGHMATLLNQAELAMLALRSTAAPERGRS